MIRSITALTELKTNLESRLENLKSKKDHEWGSVYFRKGQIETYSEVLKEISALQTILNYEQKYTQENKL